MDRNFRAMRYLRLAGVFLAVLLSSCGEELEEPEVIAEDPVSIENPVEENPDVSQTPSGRKILAIGNSFTINATDYIPRLLAEYRESDITFSRLTRPSCSLEMHWANHVSGKVDYEFEIAENGGWRSLSRSAIDDVLELYDWDVIVIQQVSGLSGIYSSYQPYLDNLIDLFATTNSHPMIVWHRTWAYPATSNHPDFKNYGNSTSEMERAILLASDLLPEEISIRIPSMELINEMRASFPERKDGFTPDGFHLADGEPCYAVACLWHEMLVTPATGISCLDEPYYPIEFDRDGVDRIIETVKRIMPEK